MHLFQRLYGPRICLLWNVRKFEVIVGFANDRICFNSERLRIRKENRAKTELDESLLALPTLEGRFPDEHEIPQTGQEIRRLSRMSIIPTSQLVANIQADKQIGILLDLYDISFVPSTFLHEKKATYLRFVGAGRALMHRVLD